MIDDKDLLGMIKQTRLHIKFAEDESTQGTETRKGTKILVLNLVEQANASSSIPVMAGGVPRYLKVSSAKVYVAGDTNVEAFKKDTVKQDDGTFIYQGPMHLDVSKIKLNNRTSDVRQMSRVWLTTVKFANGGVALIEENRQKLNSIYDNLFKDETKVIVLDDLNAAEFSSAQTEKIEGKIDAGGAVGEDKDKVKPKPVVTAKEKDGK